jgi:acetyl esterase/lipase
MTSPTVPPAEQAFEMPPQFMEASSYSLTESLIPGARQVTDIIYANVLGYRPLTLDLYVPDTPAASRGIVLYIHGGAWLFGSNKVDGWQEQTRDIISELVAAGLAVASVQYRFSGEATFPACSHDVHAALRWVASFGGHWGLSPEHVAVWGESAGGHLAALLGMNSSNEFLTGQDGVFPAQAKIKASACWYPPTDFSSYDDQHRQNNIVRESLDDAPETLLIGKNPNTHRDLAIAASPVTYVSSQAAEFLIIHGAVDSVVPYQQSQELAEGLLAAGVPTSLVIVPGAEHVFGGVDMAPLITQTVDWLCDKLSS